MHSFHTGHRHLQTWIALSAFLCSLLAPLSAGAQDFVMLPPLGDKAPEDNIVMFELRPHCDSVEFRTAFGKPDKPGTAAVADSSCAPFEVKDPLSRQTPVLKEGEPLDLDLVIHNAPGKAITRFRAWIAYDPTALEGELIEIAKAYPTPTPGEADFSMTDGYIKLSGTADTAQSGKTQILARIRLHALPTVQSSVPMTFYDGTGAKDAHTILFTKDSAGEAVVFMSTPGSLVVRMTPSVPAAAGSGAGGTSTGSTSTTNTTNATNTTPGSDTESADSSSVNNSTGTSSAQTSVSSVANTSQASTSSTAAAPVSTPGVFSMLQVQRLRVTTEGSSVFLSWDILPSAELVGYNVYYGTISGQYLQKRSVDKNSSTITIRALPTGVTYYFAVRGVNAENRETDFSHEAGISVGNPATSTSPLTASSLTQSPKTPKTGGTVSGDTGLPSALLLFLLVSAVMGTGLAFRRQLSAKV